MWWEEVPQRGLSITRLIFTRPNQCRSIIEDQWTWVDHPARKARHFFENMRKIK